MTKKDPVLLEADDVEEAINLLTKLMDKSKNEIDAPSEVVFAVSRVQEVWCNLHNLLISKRDLDKTLCDKIQVTMTDIVNFLNDLADKESPYYSNLDIINSKTNKLVETYYKIIESVKESTND